MSDSGVIRGGLPLGGPSVGVALEDDDPEPVVLPATAKPGDVDSTGHMRHWLAPVLVALIGAFMIMPTMMSMIFRIVLREKIGTGMAIFGLALFLYSQLTSDNPLLDLRVFKYRSFLLSNLLVIVTTIGMFAGIFFIPLFLQGIRGMGAMETGFLMMPGALASGAMMAIVGKLYDKVGPRPLVVIGILGLAVLTYNFHNLNMETATGTIMV